MSSRHEKGYGDLCSAVMFGKELPSLHGNLDAFLIKDNILDDPNRDTTVKLLSPVCALLFLVPSASKSVIDNVNFSTSSVIIQIKSQRGQIL